MTDEIIDTPQDITQDVQQDSGGSEPSSTPNDEPASQQPTTPDTSTQFQIPDEYKEKGWSEKIKSPEDLWKQLDSAQSLIGKKSIVPEFKDGQEKLEYLAQFKPSEKSEYTEIMPESGWQEGAREFFTDAFDEANLTREQAEKVLARYQEYETNLQGDLYSDDGWKNTLKEVFPENTEKAANEASAILKANVSEDRRAMFDAMPNNLRGLVIELTHNLSQRYGAKAEHVPTSSSSGSGSVNIEEKRANIRQQMMDLSKKPHTQADKNKLIQSLKETY